MAKKILIVDDEPHIVRLLVSRLKANKYEVVAAYDGLQATRMAHEQKPDIIILDIKMSAESGITVYENLSMTADTATIPVIFITAYPSEDIRKKVLEMGAADFISKPFNADDLLAKIKKALEEVSGE